MFNNWFDLIYLTVVTLLKLKIDCVNNFQFICIKSCRFLFAYRVFKIIVQASHKTPIQQLLFHKNSYSPTT